MSLDAGSVHTTLTGRFDPAAFMQFDAANKKSASTMQASEVKMTASATRTAEAQQRMAASAARTATAVSSAANEQATATRRASTSAAAAASEVVASDTRRAASAGRAASARTAAAAQEAAAAKQSEVAARRTAGMWAAIDRAQLSTYGSTRLVSQSQRDAKRSLETLGTAAKYTAAGGLLAFVYAGYQSVKMAADVEQQLNIFQTTAQATDAQMRKVSATAVRLGGDLSLPATSAADAADVMVQLAKGGFTVAQSMAAAKGTLQLAAAAGIDNAKAAEIQVDALRAFNLEAGQSGHVANLLAAAAAATSVEVPQIAMALRQSAEVAHQFNIPIEQTVGMISQLANAGIKGSDAGTSLKTMLLALIPNSARAASEMKRLGVETFDAGGRMLPIPQIIRSYAGALKGLSQEQQAAALKTIFGNDAFRAAAVILGKGVRAHDDMVKAVERNNAASDMAGARMRGLKGAAAGVQNAWETLATTAGMKLLPRLTELGNHAAATISRFVDTGGAARLGDDLADGLDTAISVMGDFVHVGGDVAGVLVDIGGAMHLGDPGVLVSIAAAFGAFKIAGVVAPMVIALGAAINTLVLNARTASGIGAFLAELNPVTAIAVGVGALAGAFAYLATQESSEEEAARAVADAKRDEAAAMQEVRDQVLGAASATFAARHADEQLAEARRRLADAARRYGRDSKQYRDALDAENEAALRSTAEHDRLARTKRELAAADARAAEQAQGRIKSARELLDMQVAAASQDARTVRRRNAGFSDQAERNAAVDAQLRDRLAAAWGRYNAEVQAAAKGSAQAALSEMQLARVLNGQRLITDQNALSVAKLTDVYNHLPRDAKIQLATTSQPALAQIGNLVGALRDVPRERVIQILARADSAKVQIASLTAVLRGVPPQKIINVLARAENARTQLAAVRALAAGVPPSKVMRILSQGGPNVLAQLQRLINTQLPGKTQQIHGDASNVFGVFSQLAGMILSPIIQPIIGVFQGTQGKPRAAGKAAGAGEDAVVGEGSRWQGAREAIVDRSTGTGFIVDRPTAMWLSDDHYVIPLDEHRSAAMGLMAALARDMGLTGYARGRKAPRASAAGKRKAHKPRKIPPKLRPQRLPFDELEQKVNATHTKLDADRSKIQSLPGQISSTEASIRDIERRSESTAKERANKAEDLQRAKKKLAAQNAELRKAKADAEKQKRALNGGKDGRGLEWRLKKAKEFQAALDRQTDLANLAQQEMTLADNQDDDGAFSAAQSRRTDALRELQRLLGLAKSVAGISPAYARRLQQEINQALIDQQDTGGAEPTDPDPEPSEPLTDAERARLSKINADIALAGLTEGLGDDTSAAQSLVDFLGGVLSEVQADPAHRGGDDAIADIAGQLRQAKDNLRSLTTGGTNSNPDLQAQLDQANARTADAEARARIDQQALAVFGGSGDIGGGGRNAFAAAAGQPSITINTLHPGDSSTLRAIGEASVAGFGLQGVRRSPRGSVGP